MQHSGHRHRHEYDHYRHPSSAWHQKHQLRHVQCKLSHHTLTPHRTLLLYRTLAVYRLPLGVNPVAVHQRTAHH